MLYVAPTNPFNAASAYLGRAGVLTPWGVLAFGGRAPNSNELETQIVWRVRARARARECAGVRRFQCVA